jgi:hypothetical protein
MGTFGSANSMLNHAAIAIDRFRAISQPISYGNTTTRTVQLNIVLVWMMSLGITAPQMIINSKVWPKEYTEKLVCSLSHVGFQNNWVCCKLY